MKDKASLIECLKTTPIIQVACQKAGIGRATYYRWLEEDTEFEENSQKALEDGIHFISDLAESQLIALIKEKHPTAIFYWLNHHKPPYSGEKVMLTSEERKELMENVASPNPLFAYEFLAEKTIQGKIPKFLFSILSSIISKSTKFYADDIDLFFKASKTVVKRRS